jgi:hypothetical protein
MGLLDRFRRRQPVDQEGQRVEREPEEDVELPEPATPDQIHELFSRPTGTAINDEGRSLALEHLTVGELAFPSGRVAFCDPFVGDGTLFVSVPPGSVGRATALGVRLAPDHLRVAALALDLSHESVADWSMYVPEGESLDEGSIWGFGVDAGLACFADPAALDALHALQARYYDQPGPLTGPEPVVDEMHGGERPAYALVYDVEPGLKLAISESGWGDGLYPTFVGAAAGGEPARLMISFDVLSAGFAI